MRFLLFVVAIAVTSFAIAHGEKPHAARDVDYSKAEEMPFGREGDPKKVSRTVNLDMSDKMRFTPAEITVKQGETIRFRVKNSGQLMHEMVLGRMDDLKQHAEMMRKNPEMEHDDPYNVHVAAGKNGVMVWQFTKAGEFNYGCLVPGHFEAGMKGRIRVVKGESR